MVFYVVVYVEEICEFEIDEFCFFLKFVMCGVEC